MAGKKNAKFKFLRRAFYYSLVIISSVSIIYFAYKVRAGSITPTVPAGTPSMYSLEDIYNALAGTSYVSGATAKENGNIMQILKCITTKMNGGVCI